MFSYVSDVAHGPLVKHLNYLFPLMDIDNILTKVMFKHFNYLFSLMDNDNILTKVMFKHATN